MSNVLSVLHTYWAIIVLAIAFIVLYFKNRQLAKKVAKDLILEAEEKAEEYALKTGQDKFQWVSEKGYELLPTTAKLFISKRAFEYLIQYVFDKFFEWAKKGNNNAQNGSLSG